MGKKSKKKKKQQSGGPADGSQRVGKARRRNRMIIYGVVGFVVLAWLLVFIGFIASWLGIGGSPTPTPGP
jgi:hypothetical protein